MRSFMGNLSPALIVNCFGNSLAVRRPFCDEVAVVFCVSLLEHGGGDVGVEV